ncbi:MAG: PhzF family phenazine biosynthesis protein, partial [Defluviitaleaceae bacterium]|nr:PhzF family phenazine biosynthesis protein [Defluviitaleaceae bacterium]
GNPAGVVLLHDNWLAENEMQNIAAEINLSETAFVMNRNNKLFIRWFTPTTEVDLCGHATMAAAHVLFSERDFSYNLEFTSKLYDLPVEQKHGLITLDFPIGDIWNISPKDVPDCFNFTPKRYLRSEDEYILVFENQSQIEKAICDFEKAKNIDLSGFIITAKSDMPGIDFVSRYFAPKIGINEDPVTGSAHIFLATYWQKKLGKDEFNAIQLSERGGKLHCRIIENRVKISGLAEFAV